MYTGWITVATVVNTMTGLVYYGFNKLPFTELQWTIAIALVAVLVYLDFLFRRMIGFLLVFFAWALKGLVLTHLSATPPSNNYVLALFALSALVIIVSIVYKELMAKEIV